MARYKVTGTATFHLQAEVECEDEDREVYNKAFKALNDKHLDVITQAALFQRTAMYGISVEEIETDQPTLGEIIKQKAARAKAWVLGE